MPSQESILTTELIDVLNEFKDAHALLSDCLEKDTAYPVWIQARPEPSESKAALKELVLNWSYEDNDQLAGKTLQYNGLAPCSKETLAAVELVNSTRLRLHKQLIRMDGFSLDEMGNDAVGLGAVKPTKRILAGLGYPRLNRRQACRQFVTLPYPVLAASFFWNRYRKTIKLDREQVQRKLDRLVQHSDIDENAIQQEIKRFDAIRDTTFVQVYPESIHQRVNLYIKKDQQEGRVQHYAHSPIFYMTGPDQSLPEKILLPAQPAGKETRLAKRSITIEKEPYLTLLNLHRLLPKYR